MYEPSLGIWDNIKKLGDRFKYIIGLLVAIGIVIPTCNKVYNKLVDKALNDITTQMEVSHDMTRGLMDLKAVGEVDIDDKTHRIEIRSNGTRDDNDKLVELEWVYVINGGTESYAALYQPLDGYYYLDKDEVRRYVKRLQYNKYYVDSIQQNYE